MIHIKPYKIHESQENLEHSGFPDTKEEIHKVCERYKIKNYTINNDLTIDVDGTVNLLAMSLWEIPLNFNYVSGNFYCRYNKLISLEGSPEKVGGDFMCGRNEILSLEHSPKEIGGEFSCFENDIKDLKGFVPSGIKIDLEDNPIYTIIYVFIQKDNWIELVEEFKKYSIIKKGKVYSRRLKAFLEDFDLPTPIMEEISRYYKIV